MIRRSDAPRSRPDDHQDRLLTQMFTSPVGVRDVNLREARA